MSKMSIVYLNLEERKEYPPANLPQSLVGISKYSVEELITLIRKYECKCSYLKLFDTEDIPIENNGNFWYDIGFVYKYVSHASDSFEIWKPSEQAPLLIDHLKQDLRILIAPQIGGK